MSSALNLSLPRRIFPRHWHSLGRRAEALSCSNLTVDLRSVGRMHFPSNLHLLLSQITLTSSGESAWNQAKSAMPFLGRVDCCVGRFRSDGLRLSPDVRFILIATWRCMAKDMSLRMNLRNSDMSPWTNRYPLSVGGWKDPRIRFWEKSLPPDALSAN